ncbi:hypothetical protein [Nostoc sp.]|uniref:hypothetical protein n=1 Tax=Nostoc sp. TaxID=1180 RepID=UPI002FFA4B11
MVIELGSESDRLNPQLHEETMPFYTYRKDFVLSYKMKIKTPIVFSKYYREHNII